MLGPFWLTISTGAMIAGMGPLYGRLFKQEISTYFPYLAVSFIVWQLIAALVQDSCGAFIAAEGMIKQVKLPLSVHVLRLIWKNLVLFAHNLVIIVIVMLSFSLPLSWGFLLLPLGLLVIAFNALWLGILLGMFSARFRDIPQIVASITQVAFFLTPVMWHVSMLGEYSWTVTLNPFFDFLEIVRAPLLGKAPDQKAWLAVGLISVVGALGTLTFFSRFRARIAYWI